MIRQPCPLPQAWRSLDLVLESVIKFNVVRERNLKYKGRKSRKEGRKARKDGKEDKVGRKEGS